MEESISKRSNNRSGWEQQALINELKQGKELAKQLKNHLNPSTASTQTRQFLVQKIISSYEKALTKLNSVVPAPSGSKSNSQVSNHHASSKKRKALHRRFEQVQVQSDAGLEGPLDDGHSWRKYGQKDILGAFHPRGYYRCTHRHVHGCLAMKQVQRSDEDPTVFHVTYLGQHTCTKAAHSSTLASPEPEQEKGIKFDQFRFSSLAFPMFSSSATTSGNMFEADQSSSSCFLPFYTDSESDFFQPCNGLSQLSVDVSESELVEAGAYLNSVSNSPMGVLDLDLDFPTGSAGLDFYSFLSDLLDF